MSEMLTTAFKCIQVTCLPLSGFIDEFLFLHILAIYRYVRKGRYLVISLLSIDELRVLKQLN